VSGFDQAVFELPRTRLRWFNGPDNPLIFTSLRFEQWANPYQQWSWNLQIWEEEWSLAFDMLALATPKMFSFLYFIHLRFSISY
jgi:hypothetical protein